MAAAIRIGEINSYSDRSVHGFTVPYRKGIELALQRVNLAGGVLGRPLEIIHRDDRFDPQIAADEALSLIRNERVDVLLGTFNSDVARRVSQVTTQEKILFFAGEPRSDALVWDEGSRYAFRLRTSQSMMMAILLDRLARLPQHRWAVMGHSYPAARRLKKVFEDGFTRLRPDIEWADGIEFGHGAFDAAIDWIERVAPEAVFAPLLGPDLVDLAREGNRRGAFEGRVIANPLAGEPEYMLPLGADTPEDWIVLGYPAEEDLRPANQAFCAAYRGVYGEAPTLGSLLGYMLIEILAAAIRRAGAVETEALIAGFEGLEIEMPLGKLRIRAGDHQSTMGAWVGRLTNRNGVGALKDWVFLDGADYLPSEADAARLRPAETQTL